MTATSETGVYLTISQATAYSGRPIQIAIEKLDADGGGHGYRIAGPKFTLSGSKVLRRVKLDQHKAANIRRYLEHIEEGVGRLIATVHERLGGGVDIQTFSNGSVEVRWRRLYRAGPDDRGELSDERFTSAPDLVAALRNVLAHEDEADRLDADEAEMAVEATR